jgi:hypothetical protein
VQYWTPNAHGLRSPSSSASYLAMFLLHLSISAMNCNHTAYLRLMAEGDISIVAAPALETL